MAYGEGGIGAAWATAGQVYFARVADPSDAADAPGRPGNRKHPAVAVAPDVLGTPPAPGRGDRRQKGGNLAWCLFDPSGRPTEVSGRVKGGIPVPSPDCRGPARRGVHRLPLIGGGNSLRILGDRADTCPTSTSVDEWANPLMRKSFALRALRPAPWRWLGLVVPEGGQAISTHTDEVYGFSLDAPRFPGAVAGD